MKVYYAHCMAIYDTPQERRDFNTLVLLGFEVVNPNSPEINERCDALRTEIRHWNANADADASPDYFRDAGKEVMDTIFKPLVEFCDAVVFRALPDGSIPAGVARELEWAKGPVLELPGGIRRFLTVAETRQYLHEVGQR
jgi:uncharacterized small protein (DUF1192 family)